MLTKELMIGCRKSYKYTILNLNIFNVIFRIHYMTFIAGDSTDLHAHDTHSLSILLSGTVNEVKKRPNATTNIAGTYIHNCPGHMSKLRKGWKHSVTGMAPMSRVLTIQWGRAVE